MDLSLSDEVVDLYLDRTDVAIRVGKLRDSSLMARKIGETRRRIVASPAYLERHGTPLTPEDLIHHNCLGFNFRRAMPLWPMREGGRIVERMLHRFPARETMQRRSGGWPSQGSASSGLPIITCGGPMERGELVEILADSDIGEVDENPSPLSRLPIPAGARARLS